MTLADKIMILRKQKGWSQEELAEKMGVSRQSVSKWEAGSSIPDIEKLIKIGEIFEVTLDYLVKDNREEESLATDSIGEVRYITMEEAKEYMELIRIVARRIAYGVMAILLALIPLFILGGLSETGKVSENFAAAVGVGILIIVVAAAVAVFILNGLKLGPYEYLEKEEIKLQYGADEVIEKKKEEFAETFRSLIAIGVVLCIIGVVPLIVVGTLGASDMMCIYMLCVLMAMVAIAVYLFIWACMIEGSFNRLLQRGDYTVSKKRNNKKYGPLASVYWCLVTAVYLFISFYFRNWDVSWIIWPVAGVAFGALMGILSAVNCSQSKPS